MKQYTIHKTRGTCKFVTVYAERIEFSGGAISFWVADTLVMAYAYWAWKTVMEEKHTSFSSDEVT